MQIRSTSHQQRKTSRGSVTVEAAFVLPFFIFSTLSSIELGRSINAYMAVSRIAYEGARVAAGTPGLSPGQSLDADCNTALPTCSPALMKIRERVRGLMLKSNFQPQSYTLRTSATSVEDTSGESTPIVTFAIDATLEPGMLLAVVLPSVVRRPRISIKKYISA